MARMRGRPKNDGNDEKMELPPLDKRFVPQFTASVPEWAANVTNDLVSEANVKGSPGFDPGPDQALQVEQMSALGMSARDISAVLRIEEKLLTRYYKYEIETASTRINNHVAKVALQMALAGTNPDMTKFWLKTRAGWKETKEVQMVGANGGPIEFQEIKRRMIESIEAEITDIEYEERKTA